MKRKVTREPRDPASVMLDAVTLDWVSRFLNRMAFVVGSRVLRDAAKRTERMKAKQLALLKRREARKPRKQR